MEPYEAIKLLEVILRDLIRSELGEAWSADLSEEGLQNLRLKLAEESKKRKGIITSTDLLDYTEFTQLQRIILNHNSIFQAALGKKRRVEDSFGRLNGLRNPTMHSRPLLQFEKDLLNGLVGEFRNQITLFRSAEGPDMQHYPVVESVRDSFGRLRTGGSHNSEHQNIRVYPGEPVTFECEATDPQGRKLTWELRPNNQLEYGETREGSEVKLTWVPSADHVQEYFVVWIRMSSDGLYHRRNHCDEEVAFVYSVNPPR